MRSARSQLCAGEKRPRAGLIRGSQAPEKQDLKSRVGRYSAKQPMAPPIAGPPEQIAQSMFSDRSAVEVAGAGWATHRGGVVSEKV